MAKSKEIIKDVIAECEVCGKNNRKLGGGSEFIEITKPLEKIAIDIMKISEWGKYMLVFIDYFTRMVKLKVLENRRIETIIKNLKSICNDIGVSEQLNSDNSLEFTAKEFLNWCTNLGIQHHLTSVEKHKSNGRVERFIRTIRDALVKIKELNLSVEENIKRIEE